MSLRGRVLTACFRRFVRPRHERLVDVTPGVVQASRRRLARLETLVRLPRGVRVDPAPVPGEWLTPQGSPLGHGLYLHGGAFAVGSPRLYRHLAGRLARETACRVLVPAYRLAPEHPFPAALEDVLLAWRRLLDAAGTAPWIAGDSAGAGLALALAQCVRDAGGPQPAALGLVSPWLDLTDAGERAAGVSRRDPFLVPHLLGPTARLYLQGAPADDPRASPLLGHLGALPRMRVHACATELLRDDAERLVAGVAQAGGRASLRLFGDLPHVFHAFAPVLPEAREALADLATHLASR